MDLNPTRLTILECEILIEFLAIKISIGFVDQLVEFSHTNRQLNIGQAMRSWLDYMIAGHSIQEALTLMQPRLPLVIEELFLIGIRESVLDKVIIEINQVIKTVRDETGAVQELNLLLERYKCKNFSSAICIGCLVGTVEKIFQRAKIEGAKVVVLEQEADDFFIQHYLGVKVITIKEPCHSKVFQTLYSELNKNPDEHQIEWAHTEIASNKIDEVNYKLFYHEEELEFIFKMVGKDQNMHLRID